MAASAGFGFVVEHRYASEFPELAVEWAAATPPEPRLLVLNAPLAEQLGLDAEALATPEGVSTLVGANVPSGTVPVAQAYAGHQFGGYSPRLGDGRALLLAELIGPDGVRRDLHLKGSGRTPFARGGDGKAAVGPMLREYVISEAMHALGIPTTRSLAVIATGEMVRRETPLPGAVLARVAASHLRVGTFQYAAATGEPELVRRLADHAIERHHPAAADAPNRYLGLLEAVCDAQADLIARWLLVGFVHGVMNTDNTTISGETIDYGPCAFMDRYDAGTVFSSIDQGGRYAYGNQVRIGQWNLARLAETLLPLIDDDTDRAVEAATAVLQAYAERSSAAWLDGMRAKLGLTPADDDQEFVERTLALLQRERVDFTSFFRSLSSVLRGDDSPAAAWSPDPTAFTDWVSEWRTRVSGDPVTVAASIDAVNPVYIPRNHLVEAALTAASEQGDLAPLHALLDAVQQPFTERPGLERYASAATDAWPYVTYCGT